MDLKIGDKVIVHKTCENGGKEGVIAHFHDANFAIIEFKDKPDKSWDRTRANFDILMPKGYKDTYTGKFWAYPKSHLSLKDTEETSVEDTKTKDTKTKDWPNLFPKIG